MKWWGSEEWIESRFVDYLEELEQKRIPFLLKGMVVRIYGDVVYLKGMYGIRTAVILGNPPRENLTPLGFALFGRFWVQIVRDVEELIKGREAYRKSEEKLKKEVI